MLKKLNRLSKQKDFDQTFKKGRSSYDEIIGIKARPNHQENSRFGIMVSTKVSKKAVERNKIKRQIRNILRVQLNSFIDNFDCVVITLPTVLGKNMEEIGQSIAKQFKRLKIIK